MRRRRFGLWAGLFLFALLVLGQMPARWFSKKAGYLRPDPCILRDVEPWLKTRKL